MKIVMAINMEKNSFGVHDLDLYTSEFEKKILKAYPKIDFKFAYEYTRDFSYFCEKVYWSSIGGNADSNNDSREYPADIIIIDPFFKKYNSEKDDHSMPSIYIAKQIYRDIKNPNIIFLSPLDEQGQKTKIHEFAKVIDSLKDDRILLEIDNYLFKKRFCKKNPKQKKQRVLIVDDKISNLVVARKQLFDLTELVTSDSCLDAINLIDNYSFDYVLTDLLMLTEIFFQSKDSMARYAYDEMDIGIIVAIKALEKHVKNIAIVSDTGHHDHPCIHLIEKLSKNSIVTSGKNWIDDSGVKNWKNVLQSF